MLTREWFTAAELAELRLPGMPTTQRRVTAMAASRGWRTALTSAGEPAARRREASGGGWEYHYSLLPQMASIVVVQRFGVRADSAGGQEQAGNENGHDTRSAATPVGQAPGVDWAWFERLPESRKAKARLRQALLLEAEALIGAGWPVHDAVVTVANRHKVGKSTVFDWRALVAGLHRSDWLPALAPRHIGRTVTAECDRAAWEYLKADWLRLAQPPFASCYRRLQRAAAEHGWAIPSAHTLERRLEREIPPAVRVLARRGMEALRRMFPAQERDRSMFHALQAVNADGHKFDVFVRWPGEEKPVRPVMVALQDLYSGKILSWRVGLTESAHLVQLALGDMFEAHGVPDYAWLDNGRGFASKWITGQQESRYRFKVREGDPAGVLTQLGVEVHWTTPYSGQSKPIERAFRDLCGDVAKHPAFAGAYTGNRPGAKPEDYGSKAVPLADFLKVLEAELTDHNARTGRRSRVCGGRLSFDLAYSLSYAQSPIRRASAEQLRMCLMAAERVTARKPSGAIHLMGNRYWGEFLAGAIGQPLTVRFDPDDLYSGVEVYRLDGSHLGTAACWEAAGFADVNAARAHARARRQWVRAQRDMLAAQRTLTAAEVAAALPEVEAPEPPQTRVVRPLFGAGNTALAARPDADGDPAETLDFDEAFSRAMARERDRLRLVE